MKNAVKFYASPLFVERRWTWRGLVTRPQPVLVKLGPGAYFGHPETVARVKADVKELAALTRRRK